MLNSSPLTAVWDLQLRGQIKTFLIRLSVYRRDVQCARLRTLPFCPSALTSKMCIFGNYDSFPPVNTRAYLQTAVSFEAEIVWRPSEWAERSTHNHTALILRVNYGSMLIGKTQFKNQPPLRLNLWTVAHDWIIFALSSPSSQVLKASPRGPINADVPAVHCAAVRTMWCVRRAG